MDYFFRMNRLAYEDFGVFGARTFFNCDPNNSEFTLTDEVTPEYLAYRFCKDLYEMAEEIMPFECDRVAIFFVHMDGKISVGYTSEGYYVYDPDICNEFLEESMDLKPIPAFMVSHSTQVYEIVQQVEPTKCVVPFLRNKWVIDMEGDSLDTVRALDLFGMCKGELVERVPEFHDYYGYSIGEGFFIEAIYNYDKQIREYWIGRDFLDAKYLAMILDEPKDDINEFFSLDNMIMLTDKFTQCMLKLSAKSEYFYIDDELQLKRIFLELDEE